MSRLFHNCQFPPCLRGTWLKVKSDKEDTTLLSMADCHVRPKKRFTVHHIWNKTPIIRTIKGERTRMGVKCSDITKKKWMEHDCLSHFRVNKAHLVLTRTEMFIIRCRNGYKNRYLVELSCVLVSVPRD